MVCVGRGANGCGYGLRQGATARASIGSAIALVIFKFVIAGIPFWYRVRVDGQAARDVTSMRALSACLFSRRAAVFEIRTMAAARPRIAWRSPPIRTYRTSHPIADAAFACAWVRARAARRFAATQPQEAARLHCAGRGPSTRRALCTTLQCPTKPSYDAIKPSAGLSHPFMASDNAFVRLVGRTAFRYLVFTAPQTPRAMLHDPR